jgi:PST family polysaccharide transporter
MIRAAVAPSAPARPSRVFSNVLHLAGGQATATAAALVWLYFVPRAIGPAGMGEIGIALSVTGLLGMLLNPGIATLLARDVSRHPERAGGLVGSGLLLRLLGVIPAAGFIVLSSRLLHAGQQQTLLIWLAGAMTLFTAGSSVIQAAFMGLEHMRYLAYANAIGNALARFAGVAVVLTGFGVVAIMKANAGLALLVLGLNLLWMRGLFRLRLRPSATELRELLAGSLPFWVGAVVFTTYLWIDTVILAALAPVEVVGWYSMPTQVFAAVLMVPAVIGTAWFPRFARAAGEGAGQLQAVARPALELVVLLSLPVSAGLACVAPALIWTLYGASFHGAVWVLMTLGITMVPTFFNMVCYQVLLAGNRQMAWMRVLLIATAVNVVLNLVLVSWFQARFHNGALGAALSLLVTEVFESGCALVMLSGVFDRPFLGRLARTVLATAVMAGLVVIAGAVLGGRLGLVVQVLVGLVSFTALALLLRLPGESEMARLRSLTSRLRRPVAA